MQFIKRKDGYAIRFRYDDNGISRRKYLYEKGWTKREAEQAAFEFLSKVGHIIDKKITVAEYLSQFFLDYVIDNVALSTQKRYAEFIDLHIIPSIGTMEIKKVRPAHLQSMYAALRRKKKTRMKKVAGELKRVEIDDTLSSTTVLQIHRTVHLAFKYAVMWGYIQSNPADYVKAPTPEKKEVVVFTDDEMNLIFGEIRETNLFIPVFISYMTGMRLGEVAGLQEDSVDLEKDCFVVRYTYKKVGKELILKDPKTKSSIRTVPMLPGTKPVIERYLFERKENKLRNRFSYHENNFFLKKENGEPVNPHYVSDYFKKTLIRLNIGDNRSFHTLRHTHASWLLKQGVHPKIVSERLGHSNINITLNTYSHLLPNLQKEVISKLDSPILGTNWAQKERFF